MKSCVFLALAAWLGSILGSGCSGGGSEPVAGGGGVETGDLTIVVAAREGEDLSDGQVWLLDDPGDSAQALALDSARLDRDGTASFPPPAREVGIEAWSGDTLAALERGRTRQAGDTVRLQLVKPVPLVLPCAPYAGMEIHQPGSVRKWSPPSVCPDSFVVPVVVPARLVRAVPVSPPRRPLLLILDSARFGVGP